MRRRVVLGLCAATVLLCAAASGSASPAAATTHRWTRTGLGVVTQPAPVAGKFVFYAHVNGSLKVIALDAQEGTTAWSAPASPSRATAGQPVELAVRAGAVFYLEEAGNLGPGSARVVSRAVGSHTVLWQSDSGLFATVPEICPDQTTAICVNGWVPGQGHGQLRFSAYDGHLSSVAPMGTTYFPGRELGPDLFDAGTRKPEQLWAVKRGRVAWRRPVSKIFTVPRSSSDGGWDFDRFAGRGLFVGSVGVRPKISNGHYFLNLSHFMTAGIAMRHGAVAWRANGLYSCHQPLPCPHQSLAGYTSASGAPAASIGLRLVEHGSASGSTRGGKPTYSQDASVTIEGFDLGTGKTLWSFDAGRNIALMGTQGPQPLVGPTSIVLTRGSDKIALDLRNGNTRTVKASAPAWCQRYIQYHLSHTGYYNGGGGNYVGQEALYPCTASRVRRDVPATIPRLVRLFGATTGGMTAWTDTGAVHAVPSSG